MDNEGVLQQCWQFLKDNSEETKEKICDLKFLCSGGKIFHSFRLLLASLPSNYSKEFFDENDTEHIISVPEDISYDQIKSFHYCLLSNPNFSELEANLELLKLFSVNFEPTEESEIDHRKEALVCGECDKTYVSLACYRTHMKLHEQEIRTLNSVASKNSDLKKSNVNRPKREVQRPKRFENETEDDYALYFEEEMKSEVYKKRRKTPFSCDNCHKYFSSKQCLDNHAKLHSNDRKFTCDIQGCDKSFVSTAVLNNHKKLHEGTVSQLQCPHCDKMLNNASNLQRHIRSVHFEHSDKKLHECQECKKVFKDPSSLKAHAKIHTGLRPFVCKECNKSFLTAAALRIHHRIHTGERPFSCEMCDKKFITKDNLKSHRLHKHIGVTHERNQLCSICGLSFVKPFDLKVHLLKHSGEFSNQCKLMLFY